MIAWYWLLVALFVGRGMCSYEGIPRKGRPTRSQQAAKRR